MHFEGALLDAAAEVFLRIQSVQLCIPNLEYRLLPFCCQSIACSISLCIKLCSCFCYFILLVVCG